MDWHPLFQRNLVQEIIYNSKLLNLKKLMIIIGVWVDAGLSALAARFGDWVPRQLNCVAIRTLAILRWWLFFWRNVLIAWILLWELFGFSIQRGALVVNSQSLTLIGVIIGALLIRFELDTPSGHNAQIRSNFFLGKILKALELALVTPIVNYFIKLRPLRTCLVHQCL